MIFEVFVDLDNTVVDIEQLFTRINGSPYASFKSDDARARLRKIFLDPKVYASAPMRSDAPKLISFLLENFDNIRVLTALPNDARQECFITMQAKYDWVRKNLGYRVPVTFGPFAKDKHKHCYGREYILIDDNPNNVTEWREAGGTAIQFVSADKAIAELQALLGKVKL